MTEDEVNKLYAEKILSQRKPATVPDLTEDQINELYAKHLQSKQESQKQDRPVDAFTQGFGNAASFGYLPQIQAITEPAIQGVMDYFGGDDTDKKLQEQGFKIKNAPEDSYVQRRDKYIKSGNDLAQENPYANALGGISGAISSGIATGGGISNLLGTSGKALSVGQRFKEAIGSGAAIGVLRNPGDTEGEVSPLQLKDRAVNSLKDAATAGVFQGGLEGIRKGGEAIANAGKNLKAYSQNKALKSSGYMKRDFEQALGKKKAAELGQSIIDNGIMNVGDDISDIAKNSEGALRSSGKNIGKIYDKADDITSLGSADVKNLAHDYIDEAANRLKGKIDGDEVAQKMQKVLSKVEDLDNPTFGELRALRADIDDKINFSKRSDELPLFQEELLNLRNKIQDLVQKKIGQVNPSLRKQLVDENKKFSQFSEITKIARKKMSGEEANAAFGLRERISGGAGAVIGSALGGGIPGAVIGGVAGSLTTKVARQYGTPFVALTANKVAKALERNSNAIGKFSAPLIAASNHPKEFVSTVNLLLKDPEFKKHVNQLDDKSIYRGPARGEK